MTKVLLIVENERLRGHIQQLLAGDNLVALLAYDAQSSLEQLHVHGAQLVIADLPLTGTSSAELCRQIRAAQPCAPMIFLGEARDATEAILLLDLGADDYIVKPFPDREFRARVGALLRRTTLKPKVLTRFGNVEIDQELRTVKRCGEEIILTRGEYNLLLFFMRNAGRVVTRDAILNEVWGYDICPITRTVDAHVLKLRAKLEAHPRSPRHILTIHRVGYRFVMTPTAPHAAASHPEMLHTRGVNEAQVQ